MLAVAAFALGGCGSAGEETSPSESLPTRSGDIPTRAAAASPAGALTATVSAVAGPPAESRTALATVPSASPASEAKTPVPASNPSPALPPPAPRPSAVSLRFRAANLAFDQTAVRVPAGSTVTATMQNEDTGIEHNLTFSLPGLAHGDTCAGPCVRTQTFVVPSAGSFFFLCTIHDMSGTFIVDP